MKSFQALENTSKVQDPIVKRYVEVKKRNHGSPLMQKKLFSEIL